MIYTETEIPGVWIIEPKVLKDARGYFMEAFKQEEFDAHIGPTRFIQDNESCSSKGVLRGLHYQQAPYSQAKLVRVIKGCVLDVAVDIRKGSPTFGKHVAVELSEPDIQINWGIELPEEVNLSEKDMKAPWLKDADINFTF